MGETVGHPSGALSGPQDGITVLRSARDDGRYEPECDDAEGHDEGETASEQMTMHWDLRSIRHPDRHKDQSRKNMDKDDRSLASTPAAIATPSSAQ